MSLDGVVGAFFAAFTSGPGLDERMDALRELFLPGAIIAKGPVVYDVEGFLAPRRMLLAGGTLGDFREWEVDGRTEVFGDVAQHWCSYAKSWTVNGEPVAGAGRKALSLVRTAEGWRIAAVVWDDEGD